MRREPRTRAQRRRRRRVRRILSAVSAVALGALLFLVWPQSLGGHVAYIKVSGHSMEPTLHLGDLVVIRSESDYHRGEVIAYHVPSGDVGAGATVIHRIVGGDARHGFVTRGDNNHYDDPWHPRPSQIVGVRWGRLPGAATIFSRLRGPLPLAAFAALLTMVAAAELLKPRRRPGAEGGTGLHQPLVARILDERDTTQPRPRHACSALVEEVGPRCPDLTHRDGTEHLTGTFAVGSPWQSADILRTSPGRTANPGPTSARPVPRVRARFTDRGDDGYRRISTEEGHPRMPEEQRIIHEVVAAHQAAMERLLRQLEALRRPSSALRPTAGEADPWDWGASDEASSSSPQEGEDQWQEPFWPRLAQDLDQRNLIVSSLLEGTEPESSDSQERTWSRSSSLSSTTK